MAVNFAFKASLRKSMNKTLRAMSDADLHTQCERMFSCRVRFLADGRPPADLSFVLTIRSSGCVQHTCKFPFLPRRDERGMSLVNAEGRASDRRYRFGPTVER